MCVGGGSDGGSSDADVDASSSCLVDSDGELLRLPLMAGALLLLLILATVPRSTIIDTEGAESSIKFSSAVVSGTASSCSWTNALKARPVSICKPLPLPPSPPSLMPSSFSSSSKINSSISSIS